MWSAIHIGLELLTPDPAELVPEPPHKVGSPPQCRTLSEHVIQCLRHLGSRMKEVLQVRRHSASGAQSSSRLISEPCRPQEKPARPLQPTGNRFLFRYITENRCHCFTMIFEPPDGIDRFHLILGHYRRFQHSNLTSDVWFFNLRKRTGLLTLFYPSRYFCHASQ